MAGRDANEKITMIMPQTREKHWSLSHLPSKKNRSCRTRDQMRLEMLVLQESQVRLTEKHSDAPVANGADPKSQAVQA